MPRQTLAITGATAWIGKGDARIEDALIVIQDGRIASIGPAQGATIPPDARVVDASGQTAIPGLCDLHVHLTSNSQHDQVINSTIYRTNTPRPAKLLDGIVNGLR